MEPTAGDPALAAIQVGLIVLALVVAREVALRHLEQPAHPVLRRRLEVGDRWRGWVLALALVLVVAGLAVRLAS